VTPHVLRARADDWAGRDPRRVHISCWARNAVLADYNFSPRGITEPEEPAQLITEYVPWITGTQKIVLPARRSV
jgi:hypothetical protein